MAEPDGDLPVVSSSPRNSVQKVDTQGRGIAVHVALGGFVLAVGVLAVVAMAWPASIGGKAVSLLSLLALVFIVGLRWGGKAPGE